MSGAWRQTLSEAAMEANSLHVSSAVAVRLGQAVCDLVARARLCCVPRVRARLAPEAEGLEENSLHVGRLEANSLRGGAGGKLSPCRAAPEVNSLRGGAGGKLSPWQMAPEVNSLRGGAGGDSPEAGGAGGKLSPWRRRRKTLSKASFAASEAAGGAGGNFLQGWRRRRRTLSLAALEENSLQGEGEPHVPRAVVLAMEAQDVLISRGRAVRLHGSDAELCVPPVLRPWVLLGRDHRWREHLC